MLKTEEIIPKAKEIIQLEIEALFDLQKNLDQDFSKTTDVIHNCKSRVVFTGIGKSALIAQKIVATFNSTGTPSIFMHAADAIHGDLGMIQKEDVVVIISQSGETPEIKVLIPFIQSFGNVMIAITGQRNSFLAKHAFAVLLTEINQEACPHNLAPTSSTTAQLVLGDALAVCLLLRKGFTDQDFAKYHPGGMLGKRLYLRVKDLCESTQKPIVTESESVTNIIIQITSNRLGVVAVMRGNIVVGIITDGDIRRMLQNHTNISNLQAKDIMNISPKTVDKDLLVFDCIKIFKTYKISQLMVTNQGEFYGFIHIHDLLREGII